MKTVKLKAGIGITLAHPLAPLGRTPSGAVVFEVVNVPDEIPVGAVCRKFQGYVHPYMEKILTYEYGS